MGLNILKSKETVVILVFAQTSLEVLEELYTEYCKRDDLHIVAVLSPYAKQLSQYKKYKEMIQLEVEQELGNEDVIDMAIVTAYTVNSYSDLPDIDILIITQSNYGMQIVKRCRCLFDMDNIRGIREYYNEDLHHNVYEEV